MNEALRLVVIDSLTFKEAGRRMGITTGGASSTYYRAVGKLRTAADGSCLERTDRGFSALYFFDGFPDKKTRKAAPLILEEYS